MGDRRNAVLLDRKMLASLSLLILAAGLAGAQSVPYAPLSQSTIEARLRQYKQDNAEREATLRNLFAEAGCGPSTLKELPVKHEKVPNVQCVLPGSTGSVILVGAHFDHVKAGDGVVDNWSGASLLPSLLQSTAIAPRKHTYIFVGFTGEEDGLVGSAAYAKSLTPEERAKIKAMVDIDTLGLSFTRVWVTRSDKQLIRDLAHMSQVLKLSVQEMDVDLVGKGDSFSFQPYNIPVITFHSITQDTWPILHTPRDTMSAIHLDDYYDSYKLLVGYLSYLDSVLQ